MDDKKQQILRAAMRAVTRYGIKRTSMEDIANEADISRPAIYQFFRNKDDVIVSCIDLVIEDAFSVANAACIDICEPKAKTATFYIAYLSFFHALVVTGSHGQDLQDASNRLGGERMAAAQQKFAAQLNEMAGLKADDDLGQILMLAGSGIKYETPDGDVLQRRLAVLVEKLLN